MKDIMSTTGSNKPPKEFIDYLHTLVEGVIVKGESFNKNKKWLKKYCEEFGIDYNYTEIEIEDFIEIATNDKVYDDALLKKMLYKVALNLHITTNQTDTLLTKSQARKKQTESFKKNTIKEEVVKDINIERKDNSNNKYAPKKKTNFSIPIIISVVVIIIIAIFFFSSQNDKVVTEYTTEESLYSDDSEISYEVEEVIENKNIAETDYSGKIRDFVKAEDSRNFYNIKSFYAYNIRRYYNNYNIDHSELEKQYEKSWKVTSTSKNYIKNIESIGNNTYIYETKYEFYHIKKKKNVSMNSFVKVVFNNSGEIIKIYSL